MIDTFVKQSFNFFDRKIIYFKKNVKIYYFNIFLKINCSHFSIKKCDE